MGKFTEAKLEAVIAELLAGQGFPHVAGAEIRREASDVLIVDDLRQYLAHHYAAEALTANEIDSVIRDLQRLPADDLYESNKAVMKRLADGFLLKREDRSQKDVYIQLIDYAGLAQQRVPSEGEVPCVIAEVLPAYGAADANIYKFVTQLTIEGKEKRIPDGILYINGLPLVVFEFKSAIREEVTIFNAYEQLTHWYKRDIPELFKYNALCVISDGVNTKVGSFFAPYEFFYAWRKVTGDEPVESVGIDSLHSMVQGLFDPQRLREVIRHFIFMPDKSKSDVKIVCRYPQYYAATKLYDNILRHKKPEGDGKGGTYFGATGCGKSYTMLFLSRLLMKSVALESPTIILITDRTDLDGQLAKLFTDAKGYIGDGTVERVESRADLRLSLSGRNSGGVFLTTIHKFTEDTELLTDRSNVICISDEAHRSQVNLDQKVRVDQDKQTVTRSFGFAKYLHDSLPNATYVGFTGTPIDATLDVFGAVVDSYTMTESVKDEITVPIVYEGRAAKVILDNRELENIEAYYAQCAEDGASEYQIDESKKATTNMNAILGDPDRIEALAKDFVQHYEKRVDEGASLEGKAMFVCSSRSIAYAFYQAVIALRPEWAVVNVCDETVQLSEAEKKKIMPMARLNMVMTRGKEDGQALYDMLGSKEYRAKLDDQFKIAQSNFKIAIVVDMWLTGFDVPFLDTIYIDKPIQRHNLIQTISRVNRKFSGKNKGLVVDYIGIKSQMNQALAHYSQADSQNVEDIQQSIIVVKDHLDLLSKLLHGFDVSPYYCGQDLAQLNCLNNAAEHVQHGSQEREKRFMFLVKRLKAAYDICAGTDVFSERERDTIHFYLAVRSILVKLIKGNAPDTEQMNAKVREMIKNALQADGVEEIFKLGEEQDGEVDIFSDDYLAKIDKIKLPNTKIKLLQQLLAKAIADFKKVNKVKAVEFSAQFKALVDRYNERKETDTWGAGGVNKLTEEIFDMMAALQKERESFKDLDIGIEEKSFYDILKHLAVKYDFDYPEDKLIDLAKDVKLVVDDVSQYTDWRQKDETKAKLKVDLILLLAKHGYPPIDKDEVYQDIFDQTENIKANQT